jgi:hypothetical protein
MSLINSKTDGEMDISAFYESNIDNSNLTEGQHVVSRQIKLSETQDFVLKLLAQDCKKYYGLVGHCPSPLKMNPSLSKTTFLPSTRIGRSCIKVAISLKFNLFNSE